MSGLSSTTPHYMFQHDLSFDGFDRWALTGLDHASNDEQERLLPVFMGLKGSQTMDWYVLELEKVELDITAPGNLAFHGTVMHSIADTEVQMNCAGYIACRRSEDRLGMGVMWIKDGATLL
jgi:hypothetical protein